MTDWKKLEAEVDKAIKGCPLSFDYKTIKECKYQQKVAEDRLSWIEVQINIIIFIAAFGASISVAFIRINDPNELIGYFLGIITIFLIGFIIYFYIKPRYNRCIRIILDAEQRILSIGNTASRSQYMLYPEV